MTRRCNCKTPPARVATCGEGCHEAHTFIAPCIRAPRPDRTPAPVPPAALEAAAAAMEAAEEEHFSAEPGGWVIDRQTYTEQARVALEAAAPILLAAGRTAAAAHILKTHDAWSRTEKLPQSYLDGVADAAGLIENGVRPMTDYTPDPAACERILHAALASGDMRGVEAALLVMASQDPRRYRRVQRAVVAALATEGRLLPADAETRTEWAVRVDEPHPARKEKRGALITRLPAETARRAPEIWAGWTTVRRTIRTWHGWRWVGPWEPAPGDDTGRTDPAPEETP